MLASLISFYYFCNHKYQYIEIVTSLLRFKVMCNIAIKFVHNPCQSKELT